jgi:hypothetical protein
MLLLNGHAIFASLSIHFDFGVCLSFLTLVARHPASRVRPASAYFPYYYGGNR